MGKEISTYGVFTSADIYNRSSNTGDKINNTTGVTFNNITISKVRGVLNDENTNLSSLNLSSKVNVWSNFTPRTLNISSNEIVSTVSSPYYIGDFAGYNHNAVTPSVNDYTDPVYGTASQSVQFPLEVDMGELDYTDIDVYKVKATLKEGATTLGTDTVALNDAGNTSNASSLFVMMQIDWTVPSGWASNKTLTIEIDLVNNSDTYRCDFVVASFTTSFIYNHPPQLVGEVLAESEGGWDLADVTWTSATINTSGGYNMEGIEIDIDGVNYTGNAKVDIYKVGESRTYLNTYSFSSPPTISGTAPFDVDYNETVYLYFYQP